MREDRKEDNDMNRERRHRQRDDRDNQTGHDQLRDGSNGDNDQHRGHSNNEDTGHEQSPNIDKPYNPNDPNNLAIDKFKLDYYQSKEIKVYRQRDNIRVESKFYSY